MHFSSGSCPGPTEAFALVCGSVHEDLGGDDRPEGQEHLHELIIAELLRQVVDEEITALRSCEALTNKQTNKQNCQPQHPYLLLT